MVWGLSQAEQIGLEHGEKKSRIWETPTLSPDADSRTDTNLKRLRDVSLKKKHISLSGCIN